MGMECLGMTHAGCSLRWSVTNWSLNEEESLRVSHRPLDLFSLVASKKVTHSKIRQGHGLSQLYFSFSSFASSSSF